MRQGPDADERRRALMRRRRAGTLGADGSPAATTEPREAGLTLDDPNPRTLGALDAAALWGNLGVSLLGFTGAIFVLQPMAGAQLSLGAALTALLVGTVLGTAGVAAVGIAGSQAGKPSMVLLRGLFGTRASYVPTLLNVVQLLGWTTFELVIIGSALHQVFGGIPRWAYVLAGGVVTTLLALHPLAWIRVLRKYVTVAVVISLTYLLAQFLREPLPALDDGTWHGFWIAVDTVIGVSVSWVPLVSDYSRHARSTRATFAGTFVGYSVTQIGCYLLGLLVLVTVAAGDPGRIFSSLMAVPLGVVAFGIIALRELDQSFVDTYSTAVSLQNLKPRWDRRLLALAIGAVATAAALLLHIADYESFLLLIGSVFVPMLGVFLVDYLVVSRGSWDLGEGTPTRWASLASWVAGFIAYQLVSPVSLTGWREAWLQVQDWLGLVPPAWLSASLTSFVIAGACTLLLGLPRLRRRSAA